MMPAQRRIQQNAAPRGPKMHTGACSSGCSCNTCPTGAETTTINDIARLLGREVAGLSGRCKYNFIHLANTNRAAGLAAAASETVTENVQFGLCIQQIVVVAREVATPLVDGSGFLTNLMLGNRLQWLANRPYHISLFNFDAECSCCLPGDCTTVGTLASVTITNDGANASNFDIYLIGPSTG